MTGKRICRYEIVLTFSQTLLSQASGGIPFGQDMAMLRTDGEEKPAIPGSLIKGVIRGAWVALVDLGTDSLNSSHIKYYLGTPPRLLPGEAPKRGALLFGDLWRLNNSYESIVNHRIRLDKESGAVKPGSLLMAEHIAPEKGSRGTSGRLTFLGSIEAPDPHDAQELERWISRGLAYAGSLGAMKGLGLGRLSKIQIEKHCEDVTAPDISTSPSPAFSLRKYSPVGLRLTFDRPFCFPRPGGNENTIVSHDYVPGSVIKGALATTLNRYFDEWPAVLSKHFDNMRFTHALPVHRSKQTRPMALPLSLAIDQEGYFVNCSSQKQAVALNTAAPRFQPDWKNRERTNARGSCGWDKGLQWELRIHNSIDAETGASREEDGLYTVQSVVPTERAWLANLYWPEGMEEQERLSIISILEQLESNDANNGFNLYPLGRTKARARLEINATPYHFYRTPASGLDEKVVISLQSHTRLLNIGEVINIPATGGEKELHTAYWKVWDDLSGGSLEMSHYFARQELFGGEWWWRHYVNGEGNGKKPDYYRPELFTVPGSVFVFNVKDAEKAKEKWREWEMRGVCYADGLPGGDDYRYNPWLRENGFGEIIVNPSIPGRRHPQDV